MYRPTWNAHARVGGPPTAAGPWLAMAAWPRAKRSCLFPLCFVCVVYCSMYYVMCYVLVYLLLIEIGARRGIIPPSESCLFPLCCMITAVSATMALLCDYDK